MEGKKISSFPVIILLISLLVVSVLFYKLALAYYEAKYTKSAHMGVNRTGVAAVGYAVGNCAHCHEQKASIGGDEPAPDSPAGPDEFLLFAPQNETSQTANFCFQCHKGAGSVQVVYGIWPQVNEDYGSQFGGGTAMFTNIYDAFNPTGANASSHNLATVRSWARTMAWGSWITDNTNACVICHDPHYAQKNFPVSINQTLGGVNTAIRKPSEVTSSPRNLWGDENLTYNPAVTEILGEWTAVYQAPIYYPWAEGKTLYEPANNGTSNGTNLPNYVGFCAETCHRKSVNLLEKINWTKTTTTYWSGCPSRHGKLTATGGNDYGDKKYPYNGPDADNYVLSCTDCHEPHGSTNPFLLRTYVNGKGPITVEPAVGGGWKFYEFCTACHYNLFTGPDYKHLSKGASGSGADCYQGEACHAHGAEGFCAIF